MINQTDPLLKIVEPDYLTPKIVVPYRLYRYEKHIGGEEARFYLEFEQDEKGRVTGSTKYKSVTSVASAEIPKGAGYFRWLQSLGPMAELERGHAAIFGTTFHILALQPLRCKRLNKPHPVHGYGWDFDWFGQVAKVMCQYCKGTGCDNCGKTGSLPNEMGWSNFDMLFPIEFRHTSFKWLAPFKKGLLSWAWFLQEKVQEVVAIEIPLRSKKHKIAGTGDLFHVSKYYSKDRMWYTDIKSFLYRSMEGSQSKTFYESHEFQAAVMVDLWNQTVPEEFHATHGAMWAPNKFRGTEPTYTWKNMTSSVYFQQAPLNSIKELESIARTLDGEAKERLVNFIHQEKNKTVLDRFLDYIEYKGSFEPTAKTMDIKGKVEDIDTFNPENNIVTYEY